MSDRALFRAVRLGDSATFWSRSTHRIGAVRRLVHLGPGRCPIRQCGRGRRRSDGLARAMQARCRPARSRGGALWLAGGSDPGLVPVGAAYPAQRPLPRPLARLRRQPLQSYGRDDQASRGHDPRLDRQWQGSSRLRLPSERTFVSELKVGRTNYSTGANEVDGRGSGSSRAGPGLFRQRARDNFTT